MPLTPERITQLIQQAKANPVQLPSRQAGASGGWSGANYKLDPTKAPAYDPSKGITYTADQQQMLDLYKAGATKLPDGRPIYGWMESNPPRPILTPFEGNPPNVTRAAGKTTTHDPNDVGPAMPEPQIGDRDPMTAAKFPTRTPEEIAAAQKALEDAMASGNIMPRELPFADFPAGSGTPGGGGTANPADLIGQITGAQNPAPMPTPTTFINSMEDYYRLTPQQRQQAVTDLQQWRPGQAPANQLVDWNGWLTPATSPTQMTDPANSRLSKEQWDLLSRDEQLNLLNPMNVVNSPNGLHDGASGQWGYAGPLQGYNFNVHDYSDMNLKEYGKQTNHADQFGSDVAGKFSTGLLNSLNEAAASDPRDAFIRDNLTPYMKDPGNLAYSVPTQGKYGPSDPLGQLGQAYDFQQQVADKKAAKKNYQQEAGMNRYAFGSFAGPDTGNQGLNVNWNLPPAQPTVYRQRPPQPVEQGGYGGPYPEGTGTQYVPEPGTVGGWGAPPPGGWGTNPYGNPILGMNPRPQPPMGQRPMPSRPNPQGWGTGPGGTPWNQNRPPVNTSPGVWSPNPSQRPPGPWNQNPPPAPQPVPGMPGNVPGGGQATPPAGGIPPYNPQQTNHFQQPAPWNPQMPGGTNGSRPPAGGYGGTGSGQGNFRSPRYGR